MYSYGVWKSKESEMAAALRLIEMEYDRLNAGRERIMRIYDMWDDENER